jgi:2-dehydropantoate 2-reductase
MSEPSILVVGAGAVGAFFGAALARAGAQVSVTCRSDYDAVSKRGYTIKSALLGDHVFTPAAVYRDTSDVRSPPDYLILTVKVLPGVDRVALIRPAVGPKTTIVLIENGVDIEGEIAHGFPENELLSCLAFVGVSREGDGEIRHQNFGYLTMGRYPAAASPAAERLSALFESVKVGCKILPDVVSARWHKAVWNTVFNPFSILGGVLTTQQMLADPESERFARQAMTEVCQIAGALGHPISEKYLESNIQATKTMPAYKTSMALDYENRRPLEVEAILGNAVRAGRAAGVAIPALETLYAVTKAVERAMPRA